MRVLAAQAHRVMPWKNGGGSTTEIAVFPENAGIDAFEWRISMAQVIEDGAFSNFPGIDRTLSVLSGEGIMLHVAGREPQELVRTTEPLFFPGDVPTHSVLLNGPIVDLNIMTRRGRFTHQVTRCAGNEIRVVGPVSDTTIVLSRSAGLAISSAGHAVTLGVDDAVVMTRADGELTVTPSATSEFFVISLWRAH